MHRFRSFRSRQLFRGSPGQQGQTLLEYALILAIIAILAVAVLAVLGQKVVVVFSSVTSMLDTAQSS